ncbi:hypothetical protein [Pseudomonas rhizosphaerae]|uniref:hypothetical protein n=1 Tax=Pseudomonas rhizosphaerae TaxID=216142 RepID=UPI002B4862A3|nr:hypothetical protein [Pseudomonas rhizosphaerae]MEB2870235.1 hypothetical protein [Pseudomonas rhizosphaerae]
MDEAPERYEKMRSLYSYSRARRGLSSYRANPEKAEHWPYRQHWRCKVMQLVAQVLIDEQLVAGLQRYRNEKAHADLISVSFSTTVLRVRID